MRHNAVMGLVRGKPETQPDSKGSDTHQPMYAAAPIVTAAKPAT
jgi:hypothetical protein